MRRNVPEFAFRVPGSYLAVLGFARRLLLAITWFGLAAGIGGFAVWWNVDRPGGIGSVLLLLLLVLPGLMVLHFTILVRAMLRSARGVAVASWARQMLMLRVLGWSLFAQPWYWAALGLAFVVSAVLIPLGLVLAVL